jgi:hypothetical protein
MINAMPASAFGAACFDLSSCTTAIYNTTSALISGKYTSANTTFGHPNMAFGHPNTTFGYPNMISAKANIPPAKPKIMNCFRKTYKNEVLIINN